MLAVMPNFLITDLNQLTVKYLTNAQVKFTPVSPLSNNHYTLKSFQQV